MMYFLIIFYQLSQRPSTGLAAPANVNPIHLEGYWRKIQSRTHYQIQLAALFIVLLTGTKHDSNQGAPDSSQLPLVVGDADRKVRGAE